jgi:preprotein translocase subunit SecG
MTVFPLLAMGFVLKLILIILIQKGRGGGLSAAFGGGMAGGILGSKTGDFLTWVTIVLVGMFLTLAVVMARFYKPSDSGYGADQPPPLTSPEQLPPSIGIEDTTSDANSGADVNSPGG